MHQFSVEFVYNKLTSEQKNQIINLWFESGVLLHNQASMRVEQVSTIIKNDGKIVGVSTVYENDFVKPNNKYFFFRMFIKEDFRGSNLLRKQVMQENFKNLKSSYAPNINGMVVELENKKLANLGSSSDYFHKRGYTYHGKSARGLQMWYVRFDEPRGIFL